MDKKIGREIGRDEGVGGLSLLFLFSRRTITFCHSAGKGGKKRNSEPQPKPKELTKSAARKRTFTFKKIISRVL